MKWRPRRLPICHSSCHIHAPVIRDNVSRFLDTGSPEGKHFFVRPFVVAGKIPVASIFADALGRHGMQLGQHRRPICALGGKPRQPAESRENSPSQRRATRRDRSPSLWPRIAETKRARVLSCLARSPRTSPLRRGGDATNQARVTKNERIGAR